jgi:superfamily I DNA/RNA helicase
MSGILDKLNTEQREAAAVIDGPVLVLAGAGTGKTRVITHRAAHMIHCGVSPSSILGVTFTNKAAREMRERLASMIDPDTAAKVTLCTFHSLCAGLLRREITPLGFTPNFTIADEGDQDAILKQAAAELGYTRDNYRKDAVASIISECKNELITPEDFPGGRSWGSDQEDARQIYARYQRTLKNQNVLDFDDMLMHVHTLFVRYPETLKKYQDRYKYIMVDEYQDTNHAQFELLRLLAGERQNICVVGDDDQSIYSWRGAKVANILNFPSLFRDVKVFKLERNYRSTNKILDAANTVIKGNSQRYEKNLWSGGGSGDNISLIKVRDGRHEAEFIADAIESVMREEGDLSWSDFAVLYRSNNLSREIEASLRQRGMPYRMIGGQEFFKRKEVKDAAAYLKLIVNPRDDQSLLRVLNVPPRGIGDKAFDLLKETKLKNGRPMSETLTAPEFAAHLGAAARNSAAKFAEIIARHKTEFSQPGGLESKISAYLGEIGYLNCFQRLYKNINEAKLRGDNVRQFIESVGSFEAGRRDDPPSLGEFLEKFSLLDDNDRTKEDENTANSITLSTVHGAKGLEYTVVFLPGVEQNIFPHERALSEAGRADGLAEERRLFYVAITRAKRRLIIITAESRYVSGFLKHQRPSEFLSVFRGKEFVDAAASDQFFKTADDEELAGAISNIFKILGED